MAPLRRFGLNMSPGRHAVFLETPTKKRVLGPRSPLACPPEIDGTPPRSQTAQRGLLNDPRARLGRSHSLYSPWTFVVIVWQVPRARAGRRNHSGRATYPGPCARHGGAARGQLPPYRPTVAATPSGQSPQYILAPSYSRSGLGHRALRAPRSADSSRSAPGEESKNAGETTPGSGGPAPAVLGPVGARIGRATAGNPSGGSA